MTEKEMTDTVVAKSHVTGHHGHRLPRIVLKNPLGQPLDTDTKYQRAIMEAKERMAQRGPLGVESGDWRLPHAPLPARPDLSRTLPPFASERHFRRHGKLGHNVYESLPNLVEAFESDHDKEFERLRWSVQQAETLPALTGAALIHQEGDRVISGRTYFPFVSGAPMINKPVQEVEKRGKEYEFPGLCTGCQRSSGLCYGCDRDSKPHFHHDKPYRTGGGFSYYRRDKAINVITDKNPANWNIAPKGEPFSYVFYDGMPYPDMDRYGITMRINRLPEDLSYMTSHMYSHAGGRSEYLPSLRDHHDYQQFIPTPYTLPDKADDESVDLDSGRGQTVADSQDYTGHEGSDITGMSIDTGIATSIFGQDAVPGPLAPVKESRETTLGVSSEGSELTRQRLYKAPKAFQLKTTEKKTTTAASPFSTDRTFDLPKGDGIHIQKSDKPLTDFEAFQRGDDSWKEPAPFELKEREEPSIRLKVPSSTSLVKSRSSSSDTGDQAPSRWPSTVAPSSSTSSHRTRQEDSITLDDPMEAPRVVSPPSAEPTSLPEKTMTPPPVAPPAEVDPPKVASPEPTPEAAFDFSKYKADRMQEEEEATPSPSKVRAPVQKKEMKKPVKRERVMKTKPVVAKPATPKPPVEDVVEETPAVDMGFIRDHSLPTPPPPRRIEPPPLPRVQPPSPPDLPSYAEPERPKREVSQTAIEAPPPMHEPPRQRRPPPKVRPKRRVRERRGPPLVRPTALPTVVKPDDDEFIDPADYLAKYCIIHPDRLPIYERIFNKVIGEQIYRYIEVPMEDGHFVGLPGNNDDNLTTQIQKLAEPEDEKEKEKNEKIKIKDESKEMTKTRLSEHERRMISDLTVISKTTAPSYGIAGMNEGDLVVKKINYTLDTLIDKYENLHERLDNLMVNRVQQMATVVRKAFPEVAKPDWTPAIKKKKKGKKAKATESSGEPGLVGAAPGQEVAEEDKVPKHMKRVTDLDVVMRMDGRMNDFVHSDKDIAKLSVEIERVQEKLRDVDDRIEDLEDEKKLLQLYSRDQYHTSKTENAKPTEFHRRQSVLYQKMHPHMDVEMNLSELEEALQQINGHLLTEKELQFIYQVLDVPGRRRINLQLFSVIAALSEKVAQVDPFIRKLINKYDFEALTVKVERSKDLFFMLDEQDDDVPEGMIRASTLGVELEAGGLSHEHCAFVVDKFNREKKGMVDFLDFLTYVPLFIEIHSRIVKDPLNPDRVW